MKRSVIAVLLLSSLAWAGGDVNPADYTVNVHVSASGTSNNMQELSVVINGKHYSLESWSAAVHRLLALGDYKAKLVTDEHPTSYDSHQIYEFLFADKKTRRYVVVGQSE